MLSPLLIIIISMNQITQLWRLNKCENISIGRNFNTDTRLSGNYLGHNIACYEQKDLNEKTINLVKLLGNINHILKLSLVSANFLIWNFKAFAMLILSYSNESGAINRTTEKKLTFTKLCFMRTNVENTILWNKWQNYGIITNSTYNKMCAIILRKLETNEYWHDSKRSQNISISRKLKSGKPFQMMKVFCFVISITDLNMLNNGGGGGGDLCLLALANKLFYLFTYLWLI